ncbi:hypothetical protein SprV_0702312300 [Sparganum proliferum]
MSLCSVGLSCSGPSWDADLPQCLLAYRSATHSSTGHTPFALIYGREVRLPLYTSCPLPLPPQGHPNEFVRNLRASLYHTHELAHTCLSATHQRRKEYYDRRAHGAPYQPVNKVFRYQGRLPPWSSDKFSTQRIGRFVVVDVPSEVLCILRAFGTPDGPTFAEHFNKLKLYTFDDASSGPIFTYAPAFPSEELSGCPLPSPPVENSHPIPSSAVASSPLIKLPLPRVSRTFKVPPEGGFGVPIDFPTSEPHTNETSVL